MYIHDEELKIIQKILKYWAPNTQAWVYGSRATGKRLKPTSDLDLCLRADKPLDPLTVQDVKDAFSISRMPYPVEVVDWHDLSLDFQATIIGDLIPLPIPDGDTPQTTSKPKQSL